MVYHVVIGFIVGLICGTFIGVLLMCILSMVRADEEPQP